MVVLVPSAILLLLLPVGHVRWSVPTPTLAFPAAVEECGTSFRPFAASSQREHKRGLQLKPLPFTS